MAAETSRDTTKEPRVNRGSRRLRNWMVRLVVLAVLGIAAGLGWRQYRQIQQQRMVKSARESIGKNDFKQALV